MEDEGTLSPCEEGRNPVNHIGEYVRGEEKGPEFSRVDVVKASLYVEEEGGHLEEGSLKGSDFMGEGGDHTRGAKAREGATLGKVK